MRCPKCDAEIGKDRICSYCKYKIQNKDIERARKEAEEAEAADEVKNKSMYIEIFKIACIIFSIIGIIILIVNENTAGAIIGVVVSIAFIFFVSTIKTIVDLLQSIDEKLDK